MSESDLPISEPKRLFLRSKIRSLVATRKLIKRLQGNEEALLLEIDAILDAEGLKAFTAWPHHYTISDVEPTMSFDQDLWPILDDLGVPLAEVGTISWNKEKVALMGQTGIVPLQVLQTHLIPVKKGYRRHMLTNLNSRRGA